MDDSSVYADSAQAREMDRRAGQQLDYWGNPIHRQADVFHNYDTAARAAEEAAYRKGLSKRIGIAIGQMELVCPPTVNATHQ